MDDTVLLRSEDGIHYEECAEGEQYANSFNRIVPKETYSTEATITDYESALTDLGVLSDD